MSRAIITALIAGVLGVALLGSNEGVGAQEGTTGGEFEIQGITLSQSTIESQAAQEYLEGLRPILEDSAPALSEAIPPTARLIDGKLSLSMEASSIEQARQKTERGLEQLQDLQPPEALEPLNQRLIGNYEEALSAHRNVLGAFESGEAQRLDATVVENLPRLERLNEEARAIVQDLEQATPANAKDGAAQEATGETLQQAQERADQAEKGLQQAQKQAEKLTAELEKERNKGFFGRLLGG